MQYIQKSVKPINLPVCKTLIIRKEQFENYFYPQDH